MKIFFKKQFFLVFLLIFAFSPLAAKADTIGQKQDFFVEKSFSVTQKAQVSATLIRASDKLYFYVDTSIWDAKKDSEKNDIFTALDALGKEFDTNIYPKLTATFGTEATPGIDRDKKLTILLYSLKDGARGYVRNIDEYPRLVNPFSNEREMIYFNFQNVNESYANSLLAHEFMHLIELNQKEFTNNVSEDVWLNEARAEYASTFLGYNNDVGSNNYLTNRLRLFVDNPYSSLINWKGTLADYGLVSVFTHYLVDHYGISILTNSLRSKEVGIDSINEALLKNGITEDFNTIYTNFIVAAYVNDCAVSEKYCFVNKNLTTFHVLPFSNFLPFSGDSTLYLGQSLKDYSAHWQKFSGGMGSLKLQFKSSVKGNFVIPYVIKSINGEETVGFFKLNKAQEGELIVPNIGTDIASVTVIPAIEITNYSDPASSYSYSLTATTSTSTTNANQGDTTNPDNGTETNIKLPFTIDKPLSQMTHEELLSVLLRLIIALLMQGKTLPI
ncbi:MAG: hypothetical protein WC520_02505 [Candidatus Paceibacterota bacterium]